MSKLVCIWTFPYRFDAELAQSALVSSGIHAVVHGADGGGIPTAVGLTSGGVGLLVPAEKADEAREILELGNGVA